MSHWARWLVRLLTASLAGWPLLWLWFVLDAAAAADTAGVLRLLGRATGVFGLAWLLLAMVVSIRLPRLDAALGGLLRLWRVHHWLGAGSFLLLLLHPILLALAAVPGGPAAVLAVLTPAWSSWETWAGWAALLLMMTFLAPSFSFFGAPHYQRWKTLHRLSAGAIVLGAAHAVALSASLTPVQAGWVWGGLAALAMAAFTWRLLLSRLFARKTYVVSRVHRPAEGVVELTLEGPPLRFRPGQFVYMAPGDPALRAGRKEEHPYALVSAPREPALRIAIKGLGDASAALLDVGVGTTATVEGPYGAFLPKRHDRPALWIGGGIGLTPFVSAARDFAEAEVLDVDLVYCANDPSRAYFLAELEQIAVRHPGFRIHPHYFAGQGPLSAAFLRQHVRDFERRHAYVCGPPPLLALARGILRDSGVPRRRITTEEFNLL